MEPVTRDSLAEQIKLSQQFLIKFFKEIAFLIKAIEKQLNKDGYIMVKTQGYAVASGSGRGINMPEDWLSKFFAVMFVKKTFVSFLGRKNNDFSEKGKTKTTMGPSLRPFFFKIIIHGENIQEPQLLYGVLDNIKSSVKVTKLEDKVQKFFDNLVFDKKWLISSGPFDIQKEDRDFCYKGKMKRVELLSLNDCKAVEKIVEDFKNLS